MENTALTQNQEFDLDPGYFLGESAPAVSKRAKNYNDSPPGAALSQPTVNPNRWDPRLVLDLAVGIDGLPEILDRYDLTQHEYELLSKTQAFRRELALTIRDVRENGVPFASKARVQAEAYLEVLDRMVHDDSTPSSVRLECIRSTVAWGRLEPTKDDKKGGDQNAQQINVNISF